MRKQWVFQELPDQELVAQLAADVRITPTLATL